MKLSKLYSNKPDIFEPVNFLPGLNVIMAEIRLPENMEKDTHNLGKTTFGLLLDFCLLLESRKGFFLFANQIFKDFVFFLEIALNNGSFLTIKRSVAEATKISFKKHIFSQQDFTMLEKHEWEHIDIPFERAKELLDGLLDLYELKPWSFRKGLGYLLRSQDDFDDVFKLQFPSKDIDWKPYLAHILGFNAKIIKEHYQKKNEIKKKQADFDAIKAEIGSSIQDISKIEGLLLLKQKEAEKKQALHDTFDFRSQDKDKTNQLIDDIDEKLANLNMRRYSLNQNKKKILIALKEDQILFNPDEAQRLFEETGVIFAGQIKKDFQQLIDFNKAITNERRQYLQQDLAEIDNELKLVNTDINNLNKRRMDILSFLRNTDVYDKYKQVSNELVTLKAEIKALEQQRSFLHRLQELRAEIRALAEEKEHLQASIELDSKKQNSDNSSLFSYIRIYFNEIVEEVIDRKALLNVSPNKEGHLEFKAEILDESGNSTNADKGHTYRKLLCVAFDMAVLRAHLEKKFPRFVYHDGVFESLDDRKKQNLLTVIRRYTELGIQHIITLIDSDLPSKTLTNNPVFDKNEIIVLLHDENEQGQLFKMPAW